MDLRRHPLIGLALGVVVGSTLTAATSTAGGTPVGPVKPVIGKPVTVPAQPQAGKRLTVSFEVTRSDTRTPLTRGKMICDPSVAAKVIPHAESFKAGTARLAFVVPASAAGRLLKVKVTIKTVSQSATRVATFLVRSAAAPSLSISGATAAEGNTGTTTLSFPVRLSAKSTQSVSVNYATTDGTAKQPADYAAASGTLTFAAGETTKEIAVGIVGDTAVEPSESFTVTLSNALNASISRATATGTITNDDNAQPVTAGEYKGVTQEGNYVFFTVLGNRKVSGFRVNALPCWCSPRGGWLRGGEDLADTVIAIKADATFNAEERWTGSQVDDDVEWTSRRVRVVGSFPTATTAKGTIFAAYEFNRDGTHYKCASRVISWTATLGG